MAKEKVSKKFLNLVKLRKIDFMCFPTYINVTKNVFADEIIRY
jgi:hypothetical protein